MYIDTVSTSLVGNQRVVPGIIEAISPPTTRFVATRPRFTRIEMIDSLEERVPAVYTKSSPT